MKLYLPGKSNKPIPEINCLSWSDSHEENIEQVIKELTPNTEVFAKSYGATILLLALKRTTTKPKNITLFGLSRKILAQDINPTDYDNITIYQKQHDSKGSYEEIRELFKEKVKKVSGNDHDYKKIICDLL